MFKLILIIIVAYYASILIAQIIKKLFSPKNKIYNLKNIVNSLNIPENFKSIYETMSEENTIILEEKRKLLLFLLIIKYIFLLYIIFSPFLFSENFNLNVFVFICVILSMFFFYYLNELYKKFFNDYKKIYKQITVTNVLNLLNEKYIYKSTITNSSASTEYLNSKFDEIPFGKFLSDDFIKIYLRQDLNLKICDISVLDTDKIGKLFEGFFAYISFDTYIPIYIKIKKDQIKLYDHKNKIDVDSFEFEKNFDIYSENKIATLRILTADIMDYLLQIYNTYKLDFEIAFFEKTFYIRVFSGNSFEPDILNKSLDINLLYAYFLVLKLIIQITKKFETTLLDFEI